MTAPLQPHNLTDKQLVERFGDARDQLAFAEIVRRHGTMVWATAKRVLSNEQDVEDAFQATFFALAKLDGRLRKSDRLAGWLHEAARRTAHSMLRANVRRNHRMRKTQERFHEVDQRTDTDPTTRIANEELASILDDELSRLPADVKTAVVLCDLEGMTHRDAARQLGLPFTTISNRVKQGRKLLCNRLVRRGITLSAASLAPRIATFQQSALGDAVINQTTKNAALFAAGKTATEIGVSPTIIQHALKIISAMKTTRSISTFVAAVAIVLLGGFVLESVGIRSIVRQAFAQETKIVVPNDAADIEGAGRGGTESGSYQFQEIFHANQFDSLNGNNLLTRWSLRPDAEAIEGERIEYERLEIRVSVTQTDPDMMSQTFAENITDTETVVYDGPWSVVSQNTGPVGGPKDFDLHIDFEKPFRYDPSEGNLLFNWRSWGAGAIDIDFFGHPIMKRLRFSAEVIGSTNQSRSGYLLPHPPN